MGLPSEVSSLFGSAGGYQIQRSLRFRATVSPQLSRTLGASSTSTTTCTWSVWLKRGALGASRANIAYNGNTAGNGNMIVLEFASDTIRAFFDGGIATVIQTSALYRDVSAWYHIVLIYDSTQATASNRARLFVNGTQVTSFSSASYPALNQAINAGSGNVQYIGNGGATPFDGYMAEVNFIDGQALTPSSFGFTDASTGVWQPKPYLGTYGTNGLYLRFTDNSGATATTIGRDFSGNGNNFTPTNISVTAGTTNDSMIDSPTNYADGGNGRGNYATFNPLDIGNTSLAVPQNGNLFANTGTGAGSALTGTVSLRGGKFYFEFTPTTLAGGGSNGLQLGITYGATTVADMNSKGITYISQTGGKRVLGVDTTYGATYTTNDVIGVAVDAVVGTIEFFKNNVSQGVIAESTISTQEYRAYWQNNSSSGGSAGWVNFGQRPFIYTPPAGFRALNTQNFPTTTIQNGAAAFDVALYTGNGTTRSVTGELFSPNLVWIKSRSQATDHALYDTVRGDRLQLESNTTGAQTYESTGLTSFDGNGFTVGSLAQVNTNAATYVAWQWDEAVSYGFDIVTYVGNGVAGRTVSHDLGVSPNMIIVKNLSSGTPSWIVAHSSLTAGRNLALNGTDAQFLPQNVAYGGITSFNSSTFTTIGGVTDQSAVNANGSGYIAYFWSAVSGFSRFASYTGNGSTDGPFVWCGFRPRWVMIKRSDSTGNWVILDTAMNPFNVANLELYPNLNLAENGNAANDLDFLSNGFKVRNTNADYNGSGATYVFAAFAENPFKIARAR